MTGPGRELAGHCPLTPGLALWLARPRGGEEQRKLHIFSLFGTLSYVLRGKWSVTPLGLGHTTAKMLRQRQNHELFHGN